MNTNKNLRYHPGACLSCYTTSSNLRVCEECQTANYCNETCQKEHLQEHKKFCHFAKTIRYAYFTILKITAEHSSTFIYAHIYDFGLSLLAEKKLLTIEKRREMSIKLQQPGYSFLFHPKVCHICGEDDRSKLTACASCLSVFYCNDAHFQKDKHSKLCEKYQFINKCLYYEAHNTTALELKYVCCAINYLEPDMTTFINIHKSEDVLKEPTLAVLSLALTEPLSILYAINKLKEILKYTEKEFVIHIMWSNFIEGEISHWKKYFIVFLPESSIHRIIFIDSRAQDVRTYWTESGNFEGTDYIFENVNMDYNNYKKSSYFRLPNLKIAFQLDDQVSSPDWQNSVSTLFQTEYCVPLILTSPRKNNLCKEALQRILGLGNYVCIMEVHLNKFRSIYPNLIPFCVYKVNDSGNYFECANEYMAIIKYK